MRPGTTVAPAAASISVPAATRFYTSCVVSNRYESAILNIESSCGWSSVVLGKHVAGHNHMSGATPPACVAGADPETNPAVTNVTNPRKSFRRISLILTSLTTDATRAGTVLHHRTDLSSTRPAECSGSATVASKATSRGAARSVPCFPAFWSLVMSSWADGTPLAGFVTGSGGQRIVAISSFPGATSGDLSRLWANALRCATGADGPTQAATVRSGQIRQKTGPTAWWTDSNSATASASGSVIRLTPIVHANPVTNPGIISYRS